MLVLMLMSMLYVDRLNGFLVLSFVLSVAYAYFASEARLYCYNQVSKCFYYLKHNI